MYQIVLTYFCCRRDHVYHSSRLFIIHEVCLIVFCMFKSHFCLLCTSKLVTLPGHARVAMSSRSIQCRNADSWLPYSTQWRDMEPKNCWLLCALFIRYGLPNTGNSMHVHTLASLVSPCNGAKPLIARVLRYLDAQKCADKTYLRRPDVCRFHLHIFMLCAVIIVCTNVQDFWVFLE